MMFPRIPPLSCVEKRKGVKFCLYKTQLYQEKIRGFERVKATMLYFIPFWLVQSLVGLHSTLEDYREIIRSSFWPLEEAFNKFERANQLLEMIGGKGEVRES